MYCPYCGTQIPEDAAFCPKCGKKFSKIISTQSAIPQSAPFSSEQSQWNRSSVSDRNLSKAVTRKPMNKKKLVVIVISLLLVLSVVAIGTGLFLWFNNPHHSPEAVAEQYIIAMHTKDTQAILSLANQEYIRYVKHLEEDLNNSNYLMNSVEQRIQHYYDRTVDEGYEIPTSSELAAGYYFETSQFYTLDFPLYQNGEYSNYVAYKEANLHVTQEKIICVETFFQNSDGENISIKDYVGVVKIDDQWYLDIVVDYGYMIYLKESTPQLAPLEEY